MPASPSTQTPVAQSPEAGYLVEFASTYGQHMSDSLGFPPQEIVDLRQDLILEEMGELTDAVAAHDIVEVADALADIIYIARGTALAFGINLDAVIAEVHRSNMSKLGEDGLPIYRADGKVLKGPNYSPPDIPTILGLPADTSPQTSPNTGQAK